VAPDVIGVVRQAGEDLAAVDHVVVAVALGAGLERGQVGARVGLRVADREVALAGQDARQVLGLLGFAAEAHQRGADGVERQEGQRKAGRLHLVGEQELIEDRPRLAAVLFGPAQTEQAVRRQLLEHAPIDGPATLVAPQLLEQLGRDDPREGRAQLIAELPLLGGQVDEHARSPRHLTADETCSTPREYEAWPRPCPPERADVVAYRPRAVPVPARFLPRRMAWA
jgi:hypothetical protein